MVLVKNLDIFTPIIDEPEIQGEITACNVTNDIFAMNVPEINGGMLVFLAINTNTPDYIAEGILRGIKNFMENKINSNVVGGHTIYCDWPLMGGEASGIIEKRSIIRKSGVKEGDKLIITKPIGLQGIMAAYRVLKEMPELLETYSKIEIQKSIDIAINVMTTSNQDVVKTIHSFANFSFVHAMSDVTGFGLAGHTKEMLQHSNLSAIIETVPSIKLSKDLSADLGYAFEECRAHETAGGMLLAIDESEVENFTNALTSNNVPNWIAGTIDKKEPGVVRVSENVNFLEINEY
ncbi:MAG: selenide, water dikinase SelD [Candidatus Lokiarchaeota archaeon]|nr:selenide, water dikinase SelD [Candidatus Lokiarchaeota archaeon]MBD3198871.1 selenide, water dikinase SelD [Candidatus Lokiarchaeota archaeon]